MEEGNGVHRYNPRKRWADRGQPVVFAWKMSKIVGQWLLGLAFALVLFQLRHLVGHPLTFNNILFLVLLGVQGLLVVVWIWATKRELELLEAWTDPAGYEPPSGEAQLWFGLAFAVLLSSMVATPRYPRIYGAVFLIYSIVLLLGNRYFMDEVRQNIAGSRAELSLDSVSTDHAKERIAQVLDILEAYFLKRPQSVKIIFVGITGMIGLCAAIGSSILRSSLLEDSAYIVYTINLLVSEGLLMRWRHVRNRDLDLLLRSKV